MPVVLGTDGYRYEVNDGWAKLPPDMEFNADVHKFTVDGKWVMAWGEPGTDPGKFNIPHNICCDADGWVYVADRENHRVQVFDGNGKYETQWVNMHRASGLCMDHHTPTPRF